MSIGCRINLFRCVFFLCFNIIPKYDGTTMKKTSVAKAVVSFLMLRQKDVVDFLSLSQSVVRSRCWVRGTDEIEDGFVLRRFRGREMEESN